MILGANNNKEVKDLNKRTDNNVSVTVNILSNIKISLDGKSVLCIILAVGLFAALVVSGVESETLTNLIRSLIRALLDS